MALIRLSSTIRLVVEPYDPSIHDGSSFYCGDHGYSVRAESGFSDRSNHEIILALVEETPRTANTGRQKRKEVLGYAWGQVHSGELMIDGIAVAEEIQSETLQYGGKPSVGGGRLLLASIIHHVMSNNKIRRISFDILFTAENFYKKLGFKARGLDEDDNYYFMSTRGKSFAHEYFSRLANTPVYVRKTRSSGRYKKVEISHDI